MPFKRADIENLRLLVNRTVEDLPERMRPSPREQHMSASEYGHWSRRIPRYGLVNIGGSAPSIRREEPSAALSREACHRS